LAGTAKDVEQKLSDSQALAWGGHEEGIQGIDILRKFCTPRDDKPRTIDHIGRQLTIITGNPVEVENSYIVLKTRKDRHEAKEYWIEILPKGG
jgi:hypothetical protein